MSAPSELLSAVDPRQQKDGLCAAYWGARVLHELGITEWDGEPVDEDLVALRAGTTVPDTPRGSFPRGAASRTDYRFELPVAPAAEAGTHAGALADVLEEATGGSHRCIPLRGAWTGRAVERLVAAAPELGARLLANLRAGRLWGSRPPLEALLAELEGREAEGPPPEWDTGHFCLLELLVRGPRGSLVVVHDSYPQLGWDGRHLQPPRVVAAALERGDGREGGVLAVVPAERRAEVGELAAELGLETEIWDNGSKR